MKTFDVNCVRALISNINAPRQELEKLQHEQELNYSRRGIGLNDVRYTSVSDVITVLALMQLQYLYVAESLLHFAWWDNHGLSHLTQHQKMENASRYSDHIGFASFHQAYSAYEGSIRQIHFTMDPLALNQSTDAIYKIADALALKLSQSATAARFKELHIFLGLIRNTIHNMGCYRSVKEPHKTFIYKNNQYEFNHLKPVLFLYPEFLIGIITEIGLVMSSMVRDPVVDSLVNVSNIYRDNLPNA